QTFAGTEQIQGVMCEVENDKGKWFVTTPGTISINRSAEDLIVICRKDGHDTGMANVVSGAGASTAGNVGLALLIPIVGIVGAVVDHNSGAAYDYPTNVRIQMGDSVTVKAPEPSETNTAAQPVRRTTAASGPERFTITPDGVQPQ
ncbi:MAG TPA: hypothetical protein VIC30_11895, partial [Orrella sp.]